MNKGKFAVYLIGLILYLGALVLIILGISDVIGNIWVVVLGWAIIAVEELLLQSELIDKIKASDDKYNAENPRYYTKNSVIIDEDEETIEVHSKTYEKKRNRAGWVKAVLCIFAPVIFPVDDIIHIKRCF